MPTTYTDDQKAVAIAAYAQHGTAEAARLTGIPGRSILRWAKDADLVSHATTEKTADARAKAAETITYLWADFREREAAAVGNEAAHVRVALREMVDARRGRDAKDFAVVYGILIDKAELLSGQATQRIEVWSESELDRDLKTLVTQMEDKIRAEGSNSQGA